MIPFQGTADRARGLRGWPTGQWARYTLPRQRRRSAATALPAVTAPPEEEPFDDLAQPVLGLLRREEGGTGSWRQRVQDGPTATARQARGGPGNRGLWLTMPYLKPAPPEYRAPDISLTAGL
jgi:hypothetical protein